MADEPTFERESATPSQDGLAGSTSRDRSIAPVTPASHIPRRGLVGTLKEALRWLLELPLLLVAFVLVDLAGTAVLLFEPLVLLGWAVLVLLAGGIAYSYADRRARAEVRGGPREFATTTVRVLSVLGSLVTVAILYVLFVAAVPLLFAAVTATVDWILTGIGLPFPYDLVLAVGLPLAVVPALYLAARLCLAFPACVLDKQGAPESLAISWDASDGVVFKLLGIVVVQGFAVAGLWTIAVVFGLSGLLLTPIVLVPVAPLFAVIFGTAQLALARVYLENRPDGIGTAATAQPAGRREPVTW